MAALASQRRFHNPFDASDFDDNAKTLVAGPVARPRGELSQVISLLELEPDAAGASRVSLSDLLGPAKRHPRAVSVGHAKSSATATVAANAFVAAPVPSLALPVTVVPPAVRAPATVDVKPAPGVHQHKPATPVRIAPALTATASARRAKRQPTQVLVRGREAFTVLAVGFVAVAAVFAACFLAARLQVAATAELLVPLTCAAAVVSWFIVGLFGRITVVAPLICALGTPAVMLASVPPTVVAAGALGAAAGAVIAAAVSRFRFSGAVPQ